MKNLPAQDYIAGVRFTPHGPLVFCVTGDSDLARGCRVRVRCGDEMREGVVAVTPAHVLAAPALTAAPRVIGIIAEETQAERGATGTGRETAAGVAFLPAEDGSVEPADLAHALGLAALPIPPAPPERR